MLISLRKREKKLSKAKVRNVKGEREYSEEQKKLKAQ